MGYEHLWADMHSNIHHNQMEQLDAWYEHAKQVMDFWPIAYYPFAIRKTATGGELEDLIGEEELQRNWQQVLALARRAEAENWPLFPGYEWQGNGADGDHNVFYPTTEGPMAQPRTYAELRDQLKPLDALAIPRQKLGYPRRSVFALCRDLFQPWLQRKRRGRAGYAAARAYGPPHRRYLL